MEKRKINVAIVGFGSMGKNHFRVLKKFKDVKVSAIVDIIKPKIEEKKVTILENYEELAEKNIDAAIVATPTDTHYEIARYLIENDIDVFIEKPVCESSKKAILLKKIAEKKEKKVFVGHIERHNPGVNTLSKSLEKENIIEMYARRVGGPPRKLEKNDVILDLAIHDIDIIINYFSGIPKEIFCYAKNYYKESLFDFANINLIYEKSHALINVNWITPTKIRILDVNTEKGLYRLNYISQEIKYLRTDFSKSFKSFEQFVKNFSYPNAVKIKVKKEEPLKVELRNFIDYIKEGSNTNDYKNLEMSINSLKICELAKKSAKKNKIMRVKL